MFHLNCTYSRDSNVVFPFFCQSKFAADEKAFGFNHAQFDCASRKGPESIKSRRLREILGTSHRELRTIQFLYKSVLFIFLFFFSLLSFLYLSFVSLFLSLSLSSSLFLFRLLFFTLQRISLQRICLQPMASGDCVV